MAAKKIAILFYYSKIASTMYDHIESFMNYSENDIYYYNLARTLPSKGEIDQFDWVVIHYSCTVLGEACLPPVVKTALRNSRAQKVMFIQDEYRMVDKVVDNIRFMKIDLLFTCIVESEWEKVYPKAKLPDTVKVNTLTGYVPENLISYGRKPYENRSNDLVYRARRLAAWYGALGQEKWQISDRFNQNKDRYNLRADVSADEKDRIYGKRWIQFLSSSKASLGCESGASVFDFTGQIQIDVEKYQHQHPDASYKDIEAKFFPGLCGKIYLNQISPRCFECAALGTLMVLYEGHYSGILQPWQHYVPLKKDHSNMDEVVKVIRDKQAWQKIVDQTYQDIVASNQYSYKSFIASFDKLVDQHTKPVPSASMIVSRHAKKKPEYKLSNILNRSMDELPDNFMILRAHATLATLVYKCLKRIKVLHSPLKRIANSFLNCLCHVALVLHVLKRGDLWLIRELVVIPWGSIVRQSLRKYVMLLMFIGVYNRKYGEHYFSYTLIEKDGTIQVDIGLASDSTGNVSEHSDLLSILQRNKRVVICFRKSLGIGESYRSKSIVFDDITCFHLFKNTELALDRCLVLRYAAD